MNIIPTTSFIGGFFRILVSFVILIIGLNILWSGEKSYIQIKEQIDFLKKNTTQASSDKINPLYDKKLVYVVGVLSSSEHISDKEFNLKLDALRYLRKVEMYQWHESKQAPLDKKIATSSSGSEGHHYHKNWFEKFLDSSIFHHKFGHNNPQSMPHKSLRKDAKVIKLGAYAIHKDFHKKLDSFKNIEVNDKLLSNLPTGIKKNFGAQANYLASRNLKNPRVGDLRISFYIVPSDVYSIIGQQNGEVLGAFHNKYADAEDRGKIILIRLGKVSSDQMINDYFAEKQKSLWMPRMIAFVMLFASFLLLLKAISSLMRGTLFSTIITNAGIISLSLLFAFFTQFIAMFVIDIYDFPMVSLLCLVLAGITLILLTKFISLGYERYNRTKSIDNNYSFDETAEESRKEVKQSKLMMIEGTTNQKKHADGSEGAIQASQNVAIENLVKKYRTKDKQHGLLKGEVPEPSLKTEERENISEVKKRSGRKKKVNKKQIN